MDKLKIAVLFGGRSGEHEVSILSAQSIINSLNKSKYESIPIFIDKSGKWFWINDYKQPNKKGKEVYFLPTPRCDELIPLDGSDGTGKVDVVFPVLHGTYGEDGTIQGLLELGDIPYVGSTVLGSAVGMDKYFMKQLLKANKLPVAQFAVVFRNEISRISVDKFEKEFSYPLFVKPANLGSSIGISKVHNQKEFLPALENAALYDRKILVEKGIPYVREIEVSVLGNDHPEASLPGEVIPSNEFYDYDAKYVNGKSEFIIPAHLSTDEIKQLRDLSLQAFKALDLKGMARVDFLMNKKNGKIFINEVNTIPGFTSISMYPKMWEASGLTYSQLLDKLITLAIEAHVDKKHNKTSFESRILMP